MMRVRAQDVQGAGQGLRALAVDAATRGQVERAQRWLARAERLGEQRRSIREAAMNTLIRARFAASAGRTDEAHQHADRAGRAFEQLGMPAYAESASRWRRPDHC